MQTQRDIEQELKQLQAQRDTVQADNDRLTMLRSINTELHDLYTNQATAERELASLSPSAGNEERRQGLETELGLIRAQIVEREKEQKAIKDSIEGASNRKTAEREINLLINKRQTLEAQTRKVADEQPQKQIIASLNSQIDLQKKIRSYREQAARALEGEDGVYTGLANQAAELLKAEEQTFKVLALKNSG